MKTKRTKMLLPSLLFLTVVSVVINAAQQDIEAQQEEAQKLKKEQLDRGKFDVVKIYDNNFTAIATDIDQEAAGITPLMKASYLNDKDEVIRLLSQNVNVDKVDPSGRTALFFTLPGGNLEVLKLLADANADLAKRNEEDLSVLDLAYIRLIFQNGVRLNSKERRVGHSKDDTTQNREVKMLEFLSSKSDDETVVRASNIFQQIWNDETAALKNSQPPSSA